MSRFDDFPDVEPGQQESYTPGSLPYDPRLVDELLSTYSEAIINVVTPDYDYVQSTVKERIRTAEPMEGQAFIDEIVHRIAEMGHEDWTRPSDNLLSPIISGLYERGYDSLRLDLRAFSTYPGTVCGELVATKMRPLSLTCLIPNYPDTSYGCYALGWGSAHCRIEVLGNATIVGQKAVSCEFLLRGNAGYLGASANDCVFRLFDVEEASVLVQSEQWSGGTSEGPWVIDHYRLEQKGDGFSRKSFMNSDFFQNGNSILIPDGEGWKEVTP